MSPVGSRAHALVTALAALAWLTATGCDKQDNDWHQPGEPESRGAPDLALAVSYQPADGARVHVGEALAYTVTLSNAGGAADSVTVAVTLPALVMLDQAVPTRGAWDDAAGLWAPGRLEADATAALTLAVTVADSAVGAELVFEAEILTMAPADTGRGDHLARVSVTVANSPPRAGDDAYSLAEGATLTVPEPGLLGNDQDDQAISLRLDPVAGPAHGQLTILASGAFSYVHDGGEAPADSFRYAIDDASAEADTATVRLSVDPVNDPPVLAVVPGYTILEGAVFAPIDLDPLVSDDDHADPQLQWSILGADALGVVVSAGRVLFVTTPGQHWNGAETLTFTVRDPDGAEASADVLFTVTSVNDPPVVAALPSQSVPVGGVFLAIPLDNVSG